MKTSKRAITKKKILSKEKPPETAEKKKNKQTNLIIKAKENE